MRSTGALREWIVPMAMVPMAPQSKSRLSKLASPRPAGNSGTFDRGMRRQLDLCSLKCFDDTLGNRHTLFGCPCRGRGSFDHNQNI